MLLFVWFHFGHIEASSSIFDKTIPSFPCKNNITCEHGEPHIMCVSQPPQCQPFQPLNIGPEEIYYFLLGHNGLRNRVARQYNIANMNFVHWSTKLQMRAERFVRSCRVEHDSCQKIGPPETRVSHNFHFHQGDIHEKWPANLVRKWYNEFHYKETWENFNKIRQMGRIGNYSHLIYPTVELIGCNGANFSDGSFFVCYYWPRSQGKYQDDFAFGEPCSKCSPQLPACSRVFEGLCGIDLKMSSAMSILQSFRNQVLVSFIFLISVL